MKTGWMDVWELNPGRLSLQWRKTSMALRLNSAEDFRDGEKSGRVPFNYILGIFLTQLIKVTDNLSQGSQLRSDTNRCVC
jgi:hypothetical protein